jgi:Uma2 family endonuclease
MRTVQLRRWTRQEYDRLTALGVLRPDERVELIEGEIVEMPPQLSRHATGVYLAHEALRAIYDVGFVVRVHLPLALGPYSEPEPDVAVVAGSGRDFADAHPTSALLVVEVSDTTLSFDRQTKASLYAASGIPEYWLLNLVDSQLEIHREPDAMSDTRFSFGYRTRTVVRAGDICPAPGVPGARLAVADLLP